MSMRLTSLELREVRIPFRFSFRHSLAERSEARNLILKVKTSRGQVGFGEVVPREYLTGETLDGAWVDICERWWPQVRGLEFPREKHAVEILKPVYSEADKSRKTASYSGIDIAVVDAWAREFAVSGFHLFGEHKCAPVRLSAPLGGGGVKSIKKAAWIFRLLGFKDFKLKTGREDDAERIAVARAAIGSGCDLRVDANCGWTVERVGELMPELKKYHITSVEQPVSAGDENALAEIQKLTGIPVMADESLCTKSDAEKLLAASAAKIWNVRLAKVGGFCGMSELCRIAMEKRIDLHLGVLVGETGLLSSALRACLPLAKFRHVEYGFPKILLKPDPFRGGPAGYFGYGKPLGERFGLGVNPDPAQLERVTVRKTILE